jgi:hypothetical protein
MMWKRKVTLDNVQLANRIQWIKDLISGEFGQGEGCLKAVHDDGTIEYCCLGIACERVAPSSRSLVTRFDGTSGSYLPREAAILMGFGTEFTEVNGDQHVAALWNDDKRLSFARIADLVAFATERKMRFREVQEYLVPVDYAIEWLESQ